MHPVAQSPIAPRVQRGYHVISMKRYLLDRYSASAIAQAIRPFTASFLCCGVVGLLTGCSSEPDSHVVSAPPPPAPTQQVITTAAPAGNTIVVTQAPPALQQEVVLAQPSSQHVWIAGYWTWRNSRYEWMAGHWELPPSSGSVWIAPRWEQQGNAYRFYEGYWN